jgi:hypothetical protein
MRTYFNLFVLFFSGFIFFTACDEETVVPLVDETNNGFQSKEVAEIFAKNCTESGCHGNSDAHHALKFTSFSEMIKGSIGRPLGDHIMKVMPKSMHGDAVYGGSPIVSLMLKKFEATFSW